MGFDIQPQDVPAIRIAQALGSKVNNDLLFIVGGGLGDRICAEPTVRYAIENFKDCKISIAMKDPELFHHLNFHKIYDFKTNIPKEGQHLVLRTYPEDGTLINQFMTPSLTHSVDFASISALRRQLSITEREIKIRPFQTSRFEEFYKGTKQVLVHPGKGWPSRTFPSDWWNRILIELRRLDFRPVLVGQDTVEVDPTGCVDLRGNTTQNEFIWLCMNMQNVLSNDSSPIHAAAAGRANICFIPTCRDFSLLIHYREGELGKKTAAICKRAMWREFNTCPNHLEPTRVDLVPSGDINDYLPQPETIAHSLEFMVKQG